MSDESTQVVPVWTLSTSEGPGVPVVAAEGALTSERLAELRTALATFSSVPLVSLEAHPLTQRRPRPGAIPLDAVSPLAQELARLVASSAGSVAPVAAVAESREVLYRMVVPAKVAAQFGKGLVKPMASKTVPNGVYGTLVDAGTNVIAAKTTFVPVETAVAGATGTAVGTVAAGTPMTLAAPLVLMAVAVGVSAYADHCRQQAIERVTDLLEQLHDDKLDHERNELDGCRDAIDKATAILLDRGRVGASLGLDSAVHAIGTATENASRRVQRWEAALASIHGDRVELTELEKSFPGIGEDGGHFRTHVELAALAIALKRRVIVLQGVEAGQANPDNPFENFAHSLRADQQRIDALQVRISQVLSRLSTLELRTPQRFVGRVMTRGQVDDLLETSYRLRSLGNGAANLGPAGDVVIEIEKHSDGTLLVLPAVAS